MDQSKLVIWVTMLAQQEIHEVRDSNSAHIMFSPLCLELVLVEFIASMSEMLQDAQVSISLKFFKSGDWWIYTVTVGEVGVSISTTFSFMIPSIFPVLLIHLCVFEYDQTPCKKIKFMWIGSLQMADIEVIIITKTQKNKNERQLANNYKVNKLIIVKL